jgi:5-methylcytosine-specific restriction endonuclease McrA
VRCLALNASFEPLTMVPVRRALRLVIEGKAEIVESDDGDVVRSERLVLPKPAIIRLVKFVHVPRRFRRQVTNTFLFARDGYRCQYCHRSQSDLRHRECLTRDHLIPLSRGGDNDWTNVVTACSSCNTRKGNHLPQECGMHPAVPPHEPHFVHLSWAVRRLSVTQAKYIRPCGRWAAPSSAGSANRERATSRLQSQAGQAGQSQKKSGRLPPECVTQIAVPLPLATHVSSQKPLQLIQIGVG